MEMPLMGTGYHQLMCKFEYANKQQLEKRWKKDVRQIKNWVVFVFFFFFKSEKSFFCKRYSSQQIAQWNDSKNWF